MEPQNAKSWRRVRKKKKKKKKKREGERKNPSNLLLTVFKEKIADNKSATEMNITGILVKCSISGIVRYLAGSLPKYTLCSCYFLQLSVAPKGCGG